MNKRRRWKAKARRRIDQAFQRHGALVRQEYSGGLTLRGRRRLDVARRTVDDYEYWRTGRSPVRMALRFASTYAARMAAKRMIEKHRGALERLAAYDRT